MNSLPNPAPSVKTASPKHTEGPWFVDMAADWDVDWETADRMVGVQGPDVYAGSVCTLHKHQDTDGQGYVDVIEIASVPQIENAHLIAAAPDILKSLQAVLHAWANGADDLETALRPAVDAAQALVGRLTAGIEACNE